MKDLLDSSLPVDGRDSRGRTPLHRAADFVPREAPLELLLQRGAKVDDIDREGRTPLHVAAEKSNLKGAHTLLAAGANVNAADDRGRTPLHLVAPMHTESFDLYRLLIDKGAKVSARDAIGRTPLHAVCDTELGAGPLAAELLVCRGAERDARDSFGWTPADIARMRSWRDPNIPPCAAATAQPAPATQRP